MSDSLVRETLRNIPPDHFLTVHSSVRTRTEMNRQEYEHYRERLSSAREFGVYLHMKAKTAGWDKRFLHAIVSGSDRLFLTTLGWTEVGNPSPEKNETRNWLAAVELKPIVQAVIEEVNGVTKGHRQVDAVTEQAEHEIGDYPAFVALGEDIEPTLFERGIDIKVGAMQRMGIALAGLATKRLLAKSEVDELEALFMLDGPAAGFGTSE